MYSKIALSIGGSDSGGGAGIQADLRTFMALNVHGCSAITCITAQNSMEVNCVEAVDKVTLLSQIDTLFSDFNINALKTGMLLLGAKAVLIKGGGLKDMKGRDFYLDVNGGKKWFINKFINTQNTHGSGCTLSAAICGYQALGFDLIESIQKSKIFIERSLKNSYQIGSGPGPLGHYQSL